MSNIVVLINKIRIDLENEKIFRGDDEFVLANRDTKRCWAVLRILIDTPDSWISRSKLEEVFGGVYLQDKYGRVRKIVNALRTALGQDFYDEKTPQFIQTSKGTNEYRFRRHLIKETQKNSEKHKVTAPEIKDFVERHAPTNGKNYVEVLVSDLITEKLATLPALVGNVGVGKSVIANEIGKRLADKDFTYIWSSAKRREYRLDDLLEDVLEGLLGEHSDLVPHLKAGLNQEIVRQKLKKHKACFLVLDALEKVEIKDLNECLNWVRTEIGKSAVIISRRDDYHPEIYTIEEMTKHEAEVYINNLKQECYNFDHDAEKIIEKVNTRNPAVLRRVVELLEARFKLENFDGSASEEADGKVNVKNLFKPIYDEIGKPANEILKALLASPIGLDNEKLMEISGFNNRQDTFDKAIRKLEKYKFILPRKNRFVITESESQIQEMIEEFEEDEQFGNVKEL